MAYHAAAEVEQWGPWEEFVRGNVDGHRNALAACREAGVRRFVHVGTEAALMAGKPLVNADETAPLRPDSAAYYPAHQGDGRAAVAAANGDGIETVVVRPRFVWGPGDTTLLPGLVDAGPRGQFAWIGGGRHLTATTHVDNVVEGLVLGAREGRRGEAYFVTDGEPVAFREFVTALLATQGVEPGERNDAGGRSPRPRRRAAEALWRALRAAGRAADHPPGRAGSPRWSARSSDRQGPRGAGLRAR